MTPAISGLSVTKSRDYVRRLPDMALTTNHRGMWPLVGCDGQPGIYCLARQEVNVIPWYAAGRGGHRQSHIGRPE